ncbi:uncharacterized protein K452DRAFT_304473 [Aplosporella prunicola CBS 121167]|uniref:Uncharacterized protein n=1 Tax=Aplosporella prunicola CBS 121167 TaxID=1176127 RepID=A0A6A6BQW6_9PEZI|nr:uncharacterized protein K452DRAFT_304473 [Aplosporella prunicola CBS 121167]KAF2146512.1 hypothetical protein K452DRAFT_304473 [Aplosporella prunicola CBS 121167]
MAQAQKYTPLAQTSPPRARTDSDSEHRASLTTTPPTRQALPRSTGALASASAGGPAGDPTRGKHYDDDGRVCVCDCDTAASERRGDTDGFCTRVLKGQSVRNCYNEPVGRDLRLAGCEEDEGREDVKVCAHCYYVGDLHARDGHARDGYARDDHAHVTEDYPRKRKKARLNHHSRTCSSCVFEAFRSAVVWVPGIARLGAKMVGVGAGVLGRGNGGNGPAGGSGKRGVDVEKGVKDANSETGSDGSREEEGGVRLLTDAAVSAAAAAAAAAACATTLGGRATTAYRFVECSNEGVFEDEDEDMDAEGTVFGFEGTTGASASLSAAGYPSFATGTRTPTPGSSTRAHKARSPRISGFCVSLPSDDDIFMDTSTDTEDATPTNKNTHTSKYTSTSTSTSTLTAFMRACTPPTTAIAAATKSSASCVFMDPAASPSRASTPGDSDAALDYLFTGSPGPSTHEQGDGTNTDTTTVATDNNEADDDVHTTTATATPTPPLPHYRGTNINTNNSSTKPKALPRFSLQLAPPPPTPLLKDEEKEDARPAAREKSAAVVARETARAFARRVRRGEVVPPMREDARRFREWVAAYARAGGV